MSKMENLKKVCYKACCVFASTPGDNNDPTYNFAWGYREGLKNALKALGVSSIELSELQDRAEYAMKIRAESQKREDKMESIICILECGDWSTPVLCEKDRIVDPLTWNMLYIPSCNWFAEGLEGYVKDGLLRTWYEYIAIVTM